MKINYVIPSISPGGKLVSAGSYCLSEYIKGLSEKGHEITIVPLEHFGSSFPDTKLKGKIIVTYRKSLLKKNFERLPKAILRRISPRIIQWYENKKTPSQVRSSYIKHRFETLVRAIDNIPDCDVNVATCYQSALAVYFSGKGVPFYHLQHFEEYFCHDVPAPDFAFKDASLTYALPLNKIVNCTWLKNEVETHYPQQKVVAVINYGMNTKIFYPRTVARTSSKLKVISYGGRHFVWKGFVDAANAMKIVREKYPDIEWLVFGDTIIPPDNNIAKFTAKGFLDHDKLAELYSQCDIMLCPSWYESFPLYPLEAMACGLAVVTTPLGTEDYSKDGTNCLLVPAKSPMAMAEAVIRLIEDKSMRNKLGSEGIKTARRFSWEQSVIELEKVLLKYSQKR